MIERQSLFILLALMLKPLLPTSLWLIWLIASSIYCYYQKIKFNKYIIVTSSVFILHLLTRITPTVNQGWVVYQDEYRSIVQSGMNQFISFDTSLEVGDYIVFEPQLSKKNDSFEIYSSLRHQYQIDPVKNVEKHFDSPLIKALKQMSNQPIQALMYKILGYQSIQDTTGLLTIIVSTGILFSSFLSFIRRCLSLCFYQDVVKKIMLVLAMILFIIMPTSFVMMRILLRQLLYFSSRDKLGQQVLLYSLLLVIYPLSIFTLAFWFPFCLAFYRFVSTDKNSFGLRIQWLLFLQMNFLFQANLVSIVLFPFFRILSTMLALLLLFFLLLGIGESYLAGLVQLLSTIDLSSFRLIGKPPLLLSLIWLMSLIKNHKYFWISWLCPIILFLLPWLNPITTISFIDVKQGDASLIRLPYTNQGILIDTGKLNQSFQVLTEMNRLGIASLKYLIVSHQDSDHSGGVERILKEVFVEDLITRKDDLKQLPNFIQPLLAEVEFEDENDNSIILLVNINDTKILYTGDISKLVERQLLVKYPNLKVDIIKLAHHGSKTSSDHFFLEEIRPYLSIISADKQVYGHPSPETLKTLYRLNIKYLSTQDQGTIRLHFSRFINWMETRHLRIRF